MEVGSEQIDDMVKVIKDLAVAWKILGDGWGGYLLILCPINKSNAIVEELTN